MFGVCQCAGVPAVSINTPARAHVYILENCWYAGTLVHFSLFIPSPRTPLYLPKTVRLLRFPPPAPPRVFFAGLPRVSRGSKACPHHPKKVRLLRFTPRPASSFPPGKKGLPNSIGRQPSFVLGMYVCGLLVADAPLVGVEVVQAVAYVLREAERDILVGQEQDAQRCVWQHEGGGAQVVECLLACEFHLWECLASEVFRHAETVLRCNTLAALLAQAEARGDTSEMGGEILN